MERAEIRVLLLRRIIAEVTGRAFHGIKESSHPTFDLNLTFSQRREISRQVERDFGVHIPFEEWQGFDSVRKLSQYVEIEIQRRSLQYEES